MIHHLGERISFESWFRKPLSKDKHDDYEQEGQILRKWKETPKQWVTLGRAPGLVADYNSNTCYKKIKQHPKGWKQVA